MHESLLLLFIGLVFFIAGFHRLFLKKEREYEYQLLNLPRHSDYVILLIEIVFGFLLIFSYFSKCKNLLKPSLIVLFILASFGTILMIAYNYKKIILTYKDLFTFHDNSLSLILHITYIIILLYLILNLKNLH